ncbi:MAG: HAD-IC family P-type ATPase, partial [Thermoguttaceae bacterium]|nr:HAD-IC family P-type ATPase [Thermoguttaceae bacterium]
MMSRTEETTNHPRAIRFKGLTHEEVEASRRRHGANVLTPPKRDPWWRLYLAKFDDPVIRILMIAAAIAIVVGISDGKYVEGIGIVIAILLATGLAFWNEYHASKEFDLLSKSSDDAPVQVVRDGAFTQVPKRDLVVGDVVLLAAGDEVPADGQVLEAISFQVDEARLTGESHPVAKVAAEHARQRDDGVQTYEADRVMRGTVVVDGHGTVRVTAVGDATDIGKTARAAAEQTGEQTPLNAQLERLSKVIGVFGFLIAGLTYAALVAHGLVTGEMALAGSQWYFFWVLAVAVLIALVKVWLPIVYDALELLGKKVQRPAWLGEAEDEDGGDDEAARRRKRRGRLLAWLGTAALGAAVLVAGVTVGWLLGWLSLAPSEWLPPDAARKLLLYFMIAVTIIVVAVPEGLAMSVTLSLAYSMRKMAATNNLVRKMHACETMGAATVICSDKTGTLTKNEMRVHELVFPALPGGALVDGRVPEATRQLVAEAIAANTTANLGRDPGKPPVPLGNPTECALLLWLDEQEVDYLAPRGEFRLVRQWTFSTERKYMATAGFSPAARAYVVHAKGAPEVVLARCTHVLTNEGVLPLGGHAEQIETQLRAYQQRGMRTLGFACRTVADENIDADLERAATGMTWLGFAAIADPVRPEVPEAIQLCRRAGIQVKIVTGDNPETAQEIGRQIGLTSESGEHHMTGPDFRGLDDAEVIETMDDLAILSRAKPMDKLRLVRLLQSKGHVVAVTGDGINDAPALNYANVGLSMGITGTSVAKEASDVVLLDDSFRSIVNAVMWGRSLYENIQRFILFQLTINVAALGIAFLGPFLGID